MAKTTADSKTSDAFNSMVDDESDNPKSTVNRTEDSGTWRERYDIAYRNQKSQSKQWADNYKQMYAIKTYKNISIWKSQMFIPIMSYKAWTIISKLIALEPGFSVKMFDEIYSNEDAKRIEQANLKLKFDYDNPLLDESIRDRQFDILTDTVVCGTGFGKAEWKSGTRTLYERFQRDDGTIDYSRAHKTEIDYGYNDLDPINAFDVFAAPGGRSFESKPWIIVKYPGKSRTDLLSEDIYNEAIVNKLSPTGKKRDTITRYKQSRNQFIGENKDDQDAIDDTVDKFDVYECYEKTPDGVFLITFAEASSTSKLPQSKQKTKETKNSSTESTDGVWFEIRNERQPYWHGKYPIVPSYIRRRPHEPWGESIFEVTESMSNGYNDLVNQLADNLAISGNGGVLLHGTGTVIYDFHYAPGGEIRYSGEKPEFVTPEAPEITLFNTMFNLIDQGINNSTVSPYANGTPADESDQTQGTLGGINALQEAAGEITSFMKTNYMQFLKGVGQRWLSNNRQFFDETLTVPKSRYGKKIVYRITSDTFHNRMMCDIDADSMQPTTKQQQREDNQAWLGDLITIQDRSLMQAGLIANPAVPTPEPPIDPATGQPVASPTAPPPNVKPMYIDYIKVAAEVNESYDKPDIDEFMLDPAAPEEEQSDNSLMVEAIRQMIDNDDIDGDTAQATIDSIEGRVPTVSMRPITQGEEDYEPEDTAQPELRATPAAAQE